MRNARTRTALLRTSSYNDVLCSGGNLTITGLEAIYKPDILKITQFRYRAEVVKVETIGGSSWTPTASTQYIVQISDQINSREGHSNSIVPRQYIYKTPADLTEIGATAALQREAVHVALIAKINADSANNVVAATLGTGTGFTITDDAGYYPAKTAGGQNTREGKTSIRLSKDANGRGWVDATHRVLTTDATYGFGVGSRIVSDIPVVYALGGSSIVAGTLDCPLTTAGLGPVPGQQYDAFQIDSLIRSTIPTIGEVVGYRIQSNMIFVDNGKGSSTANATVFTNATTQALGFTPFERAMHKLIAETYRNDEASVIEFFEGPMIIQGPLGAAPAGTANAIGWIRSEWGGLNHINIGTQTIFAPVVNDLGLLIDQDDNAGDGAHYAAPVTALCRKQFIVGQTAFSIVVKAVMGDWTDAGLIVGFRTKSAYTADFNDYTNLATIGNGVTASSTTMSGGDLISTHGILANAATVATASAVAPVDAVPVELRVNVALNGVVTCYADNVSYPIYSAGTTPLVFTAGTVLVPFFQHINIGSGDPALVISELMAVNDNNWKIDA